MCLVEKLDKNGGVPDSGCSPQSVPVDMQMLIHSPASAVFLPGMHWQGDDWRFGSGIQWFPTLCASVAGSG
jgi:hypothetical protein